MTLEEFLRQTQAEVQAEIDERMGSSGAAYPYPESIFAESRHAAHVRNWHDSRTGGLAITLRVVGNANLRLSGFAVSDEADQLDLFVSLYDGGADVVPIPDAETRTAPAEQCLRFLAKCVEGNARVEDG